MNDDPFHVYYNTKQWKHLREKILKRDHCECQRCRQRIEQAKRDGVQLPPDQRKIRRAVCVHHIIELKDRPDLAYDESNLVSLCHRCHDEIHHRGPGAFGERRYTRRRRDGFEERW